MAQQLIDAAVAALDALEAGEVEEAARILAVAIRDAGAGERL